MQQRGWLSISEAMRSYTGIAEYFPGQHPCVLSPLTQREVSATSRAETMAEVMDCEVQDSVMDDDRSCLSWEPCFSNPSHPAEGLVQDTRLALNPYTV